MVLDLSLELDVHWHVHIELLDCAEELYKQVSFIKISVEVLELV